jgi:hypothetical protein
MSSAAKKAWATRRERGHVKSSSSNRSSAAAKARATMKKGRRIHIHSPKVKVNGSSKTTYAPPARWWDHMTKAPHGACGKPLSAAAAGHLWFKVYDNAKRLEAIKQFG